MRVATACGFWRESARSWWCSRRGPRLPRRAARASRRRTVRTPTTNGGLGSRSSPWACMSTSNVNPSSDGVWPELSCTPDPTDFNATSWSWVQSPQIIPLESNGFSVTKRASVLVSAGDKRTYQRLLVNMTGRFSDGKFFGIADIAGTPCKATSYQAKWVSMNHQSSSRPSSLSLRDPGSLVVSVESTAL